ncbi:phosphohistidine phosphatase SixA [Vulcanisaeta thermophila]|uniref:phosphohistidine phosphatase SixA n=1 Tax=Vulcanisaeta thermophila TaxID=867917 RepID=UPI00085342E5|nr:phosphohistidine phosphatase SixA [Vulcanisaeta thermophila]
MPSLYLVQHGKSFSEEQDPERRLTPEGVDETERVARYLASLGVRVYEIIHSGKTRARQTAEILARYLGASRVYASDGLNPNDDPGVWVGRVKSLTSDLMIVGHLPHLSRLVSLLLVGNPEVKVVEFRYSGVLKLVGSGGSWSIAWYITPDVVRA